VATQNDHAQSVILKLYEAIGAGLDKFHFVVKALGWAVWVGAGEPA